MITVEWKGTFKDGTKTHVSKLSFSAEDYNDILTEIREFVECMEDNPKHDWVLESNEIVKITRT